MEIRTIEQYIENLENEKTKYNNLIKKMDKQLNDNWYLDEYKKQNIIYHFADFESVFSKSELSDRIFYCDEKIKELKQILKEQINLEIEKNKNNILELKTKLRDIK